MDNNNNQPMHHGEKCEWCGLGKGFSWTRLVLAILIGLFIFLAGIQIGEMRGNGGMSQYGRHRMMSNEVWNNGDNMNMGQMPMDNGTTTIVVPSNTTPVGPAPTTTPATH